MEFQFTQAIRRLRAKLHRRVVLAAFGRAGILICAGALVLGVVDYFLRSNDTGLRILITAVLVGVIIIAYVRFIRPILRVRVTGLMLVRWLEHVEESWRGRLAAAWEFAHLPTGDIRWGSPQLRHVVLTEVERFSPEIDTICRRIKGPSIAPFYVCLIIMVAIGCGLVFYPIIIGTALVRLFNPLAKVTWPQRTHLKVITYPEVLSRGSQFIIEVGVEDSFLPEQVWIAFRDKAESDTPAIKFPMVRRGNRFYFQRDQVRNDFEFRVWGGDDYSHPWRWVRVVEPPHLVNLTVELEPPEYTGWEREISTGPIRALAGTKVRLQGTANRELKHVWIVREPGDTVEGTLSSDRRSFVFPAFNGVDSKRISIWTLETSGRYRIRLIGADDTTSVGDPEWEIRVVHDLAPVVALHNELPLLIATRRGRLPLRILARDDVALRRAALQIAQDSSQHVVELFAGPQPRPVGRGKMSDMSSWGEVLDRDHWLDFSQIPEISEGELTLVAIAEDYRDQTNTSSTVTIEVVSPEVFRQRVLAECEKLYQVLVDVYNIQTEINHEWKEQWSAVTSDQTIDQAFVEQMNRLDLLQTQVCQDIGAPSRGVLPRLEGILVLIKNNDAAMSELGSLDQGKRILQEGFEKLASSLQANRAAIARWAQQLRDQKIKGPKLAEEIHERKAVGEEVTRQQEGWRQILDNVLDVLAKIKGRNSFRRQLEVILEREKVLTKQTQEVGIKTIGKLRQDLPREIANILHELSHQQGLLGTRMEALLAQFAATGNGQVGKIEAVDKEMLQEKDRQVPGGPMQGVSDSAAQGEERKPGGDWTQDPPLQKAIRLALRSGLVGQMQEASQAIRENRISEAVSGQKRCIAILQEMLDILSGKQWEAASQAKEWPQVTEEIEQLATAQRQLVERFEQRWQSSGDKNGEQEFLTEQTQILAKTEELIAALSDSMKDVLGPSLESASGQMKKAQQAAPQARREEALDGARKALAHLDRAHEEAASRASEEPSNAAAQALAQYAEKIVSFIAQQSAILNKTKRLHDSRTTSESSDKIVQWQQEAAKLSEEQNKLKEDVGRLKELLSDWTVWNTLLGDAETGMVSATERLRAGDVGELTQMIQMEAIEALNIVLHGIRFSPQEGGEEPTGARGDSMAGQDTSGGTIPWEVLLQLQTLRALQASINQRTERLASQYGHSQQSALVSYVLNRLSSEQARVVELVERIKTQLTESTSSEGSLSPPQGRPQDRTPMPKEGEPLPRPREPATLEDLFSP